MKKQKPFAPGFRTSIKMECCFTCVYHQEPKGLKNITRCEKYTNELGDHVVWNSICEDYDTILGKEKK